MSIAEHFVEPLVLLTLLAVPLVWLLLLGLERRLERQRLALFGPRSERLARSFDSRQGRRRVHARTIALALLVVAAAGPRFGVDLGAAEERGIDIVLALDVSRSMLAQDQSPTRLAAAKAQIASLSERAEGERVALVLFAGEARLRVPLTKDLRSLHMLAGLADPYSVGVGGSDLGAALETALEALPENSGGHESIVLLTDGEDLRGEARRVAERCAERGIVVHCVGFGSPLGAKIPQPGGGFVRDDSGSEVVTRMDPESLAALAEPSGGRLVRAFDNEEALVQLYERQLLAMARKSFEEELERSLTLRYSWPLLTALALLLWDLVPWRRRRQKLVKSSLPAKGMP